MRRTVIYLAKISDSHMKPKVTSIGKDDPASADVLQGGAMSTWQECWRPFATRIQRFAQKIVEKKSKGM